MLVILLACSDAPVVDVTCRDELDRVVYSGVCRADRVSVIQLDLYVRYQCWRAGGGADATIEAHVCAVNAGGAR